MLLKKLFWVLVVLGAAILLLTISPASSVSAGGSKVVGVWYGTVFFAGPTLTASCVATFHPDSTFLLDCNYETDQHLVLLGHKTPTHGVWRKKGRDVEARGIFFDDFGGGQGFSVGRAIAVLRFEGPDQLSGETDVDFLPCTDGPLSCPDPTEEDFLELGVGGLGPFPITFKRFGPVKRHKKSWKSWKHRERPTRKLIR